MARHPAKYRLKFKCIYLRQVIFHTNTCYNLIYDKMCCAGECWRVNINRKLNAYTLKHATSNLSGNIGIEIINICLDYALANSHCSHHFKTEAVEGNSILIPSFLCAKFAFTENVLLRMGPESKFEFWLSLLQLKRKWMSINVHIYRRSPHR